MGQAFLAAGTVDELVSVALAQARSAMDAADGLLFTVEGPYLALPASEGYGAEMLRPWLRSPADASTPAGRAALDRRPVWIATREDKSARYPAPSQTSEAYGALAAVPIASGSSVLAVVGIFLTPGRAQPAGQLLLLVLADQVSTEL